jgi:hypothetical protein
MKRSLLCGLASVAFLVLSSSPSYAQYGSRPGPVGPTVGPPVSPYLNLLGGSNPAVNYYLQVLPGLNRPIIDATMESQIRNIQRTTPDLINNEVISLLRAMNISEPLEGTGHAVRFGDTAPYFRNRVGTGQGGTGFGQGAIPGR